MSLGRRSFFTSVGAALAFAKTASFEELAIPSDACVLCGFDKQLKAWDSKSSAMRCTDPKSCQDRQINALLGTRTLWQERTGVAMAKGKRR